MGRHVFSFRGGDELTTMGASWFVSYLYFKLIDSNHRNWAVVSTAQNRARVFSNTTCYHKYWLSEIVMMDISNLNKNTLGLTGIQVKNMAEQLLLIM
ncbi:MAG: hypothetical protein IJ361_03615 [Spirochaetaceae bacterium]|nr:hypothetical protein [Spirochaetaceae bacterium]